MIIIWCAASTLVAMSANLNETAWCSMIGLPNVVRIWTYSIPSSNGTAPSLIASLMCPAFRGLELLESHATWMVRFIFSYSFGVSIPRAL